MEDISSGFRRENPYMITTVKEMSEDEENRTENGSSRNTERLAGDEGDTNFKTIVEQVPMRSRSSNSPTGKLQETQSNILI